MQNITKFSETANNITAVQNSKVYAIMEKVNNGEDLSREDARFITEGVNTNSYFKTAIPLLGWKFDFSDVLNCYWVQDKAGYIHEYMAVDQISLKSFLGNRNVWKIVEIN